MENERIEELARALKEFCEKVKEIVAPIVETINKAFGFLASGKPKYRNRLAQKIRQFYLDKRRKVHRCRNNC